MGVTLKKIVAVPAIFAVMTPCIVVYGLARLGEQITALAEWIAKGRRWTQACVNGAELIDNWQAGYYPIQGQRIVTLKSAPRVLCDPANCTGESCTCKPL